MENRIALFLKEIELLKTIPGVDQKTTELIVAEIGVDMGRFPTHRHLASWAGLCPENEYSSNGSNNIFILMPDLGCLRDGNQVGLRNLRVKLAKQETGDGAVRTMVPNRHKVRAETRRQFVAMCTDVDDRGTIAG